MNTNEHRTTRCFLRDQAVRIAACLAVAAASTAGQAAVILDPTLPGQYADGTGANATFLRIDSEWRESSVYWNESAKKFKNFPDSKDAKGSGGYQPIGSFEWGTGIWGLADWEAINNGEVDVTGQWNGRVKAIDHSDVEYAKAGYAAKWGAIGALPTGFFEATAQENWTAHYTGYLRITNPGSYNFGVLYDDGFFLRIFGAGNSSVQISSDFLSPRERLGFDEDLALTTGLYRFELGAYDRLEVGAVNLAWMQNGQWVTVPTEHLVTDPTPIPAPGTASLLLAAVGALAMVRMRRKRG
jgi:hypothetical protein